jgi:diadenosine tetraphosphatase ApaH/serine/threonine PP2A family protein phosphatase
VTAEQKQWLMQLPSVWRDEQWLALHGAPQDPTFFNAYVYEMTYIDNLNVLQRKQIQLCFHGHTHQPGVYGRKGVIDDHYQDEVISLDAFQQALICPGSVGQPRNRKIGAQFAVYDQKEHKIHYHNLPYPLEELLNMMEKHGFPETLMTLLKGHIQ